MLQRLVAELLGTAMLLCAVVGSGIMAERLAGGNIAIALLANTIATGAALVALILMFAPISGAHFNPAVSLSAAINKEIFWRDAGLYIIVQIIGGLLGVAVANLMFGLPLFFASTKTRFGFEQWLGEFVATFGLVAVIIAVSRRYKIAVVAIAVAAYITAAYWFTSSTSFANPAVTIARSLSDTFAGIRPVDILPFIVVQLLGAVSASFLFNWLVPKKIIMNNKQRVLILCTGNSARSQMAEGLLRHIGNDKFEVESAGVSSSLVRPEAIAAMREIGIDISSHRSKSVNEFIDQKFDFIITVCDNAKEGCPIFPGNAERIHWSFDDPAAVEGTNEQRLLAFRTIRDQIQGKFEQFINDPLTAVLGR
jgi:thioredoxin type arsenate reductase